ncbi:MAG: hypothetical protein U9Q74_16740 [Gemmatimonadota bacterium]|nr:hypothetical protein [Gemmatimonadota bacterium]
MSRWIRAAACAWLSVAAATLDAQDGRGTATAPDASRATARDVFHKAFFASWQAASISGVPMSHASNDPNGATMVRSSGSGSAVGLGASWLLGDDRWLLQLAFDRAWASLSDWRVHNRTVAFNSVDMTVGYALPGAVAFVPYVTIAPGWYTQSDFRKFQFTPGASGPGDDAYEAMRDFDYYFGYAIGAKVAFARRFALTAESRWYREDSGGNSGCGENCIVIHTGPPPPPPERYGARTSIGLQVYVGW